MLIIMRCKNHHMFVTHTRIVGFLFSFSFFFIYKMWHYDLFLKSFASAEIRSSFPWGFDTEIDHWKEIGDLNITLTTLPDISAVGKYRVSWYYRSLYHT